MYGLKTTTSLFRPSSRPTSPVPAPRTDTPGAERAARPLSKLSLSTFRRASPSPVVLPGPTPPTTVVQDGSFMEVLSLKLSEAVSKALAQPTGPPVPGEILLAGRRAIPSGRGRALGALIVSEVKAAQENHHLYRAVIRTLHRPLSVLQTNLSNTIIPLLSAPAFQSPAAPTPAEPQLTPTQLHAVALATFAGELLEQFDEIGLGTELDNRQENLKPVRDNLVSIVQRVVDPLVNGMKVELVPLIDALETVPNANATSTKSPGVIRSPVPHSSIMTLQALIPIYARALSRIVTTVYAENTLATLLISLVWRGMVALTHRPSLPPSPPASPSMTSNTLKPKDSRKALTSPPTTPPPTRFTLKLPPSRPPSPPSTASRGPTVASDARSLLDLLNQLPKPSTKEQTRLAREAVDEAFDGLAALLALLEAIQVHTAPAPALPSVGALSSSPKAAPLPELVPIVLALPLLLRVFVPGERSYRKSCLSGFGRAEECGIAVGERVLRVLRGEAVGGEMLGWLERELEVARAERDAH
ncbi:uncharacterized protein BXZ73DRAFT_88060 [Epithele typhae]|uniref:uncharacterized protein n=1 Tax=Epithele typhae TaxID=378194 RepID=UPI00200756DD|nr:uncharacterized protein BXZ73DRAFT_88060 [Epithele typhae]KAH9942512.1 hypothetical protein BXZ73DRAFT_88060 [Epithele typhae]